MVLSSPLLTKQQQQSASHWLDHQSQATAAKTTFQHYQATISVHQSLYNQTAHDSFTHFITQPTQHHAIDCTRPPKTGRIPVNITTDMNTFSLPARVG